MLLEDYFDFQRPDDIRLKGTRVGIETVLYDFIFRARTPDEVPLATAMSLIVRERLTGEPIPLAAMNGVQMVRSYIEEAAGEDLDRLAGALNDQQAFADAFLAGL